MRGLAFQLFEDLVFLDGVYPGDDDAVGAHVQGLLYGVHVVPDDPDHGVAAVVAYGVDEGVGYLGGCWSVLLVDDDPVQAAVGGRVYGVGV